MVRVLSGGSRGGVVILCVRLKGDKSEVEHVLKSSDDHPPGAKLPAHQHPDRQYRGVMQRVPAEAVPFISFPVMVVVFRCRLVHGATGCSVESQLLVGHRCGREHAILAAMLPVRVIMLQDVE